MVLVKNDSDREGPVSRRTKTVVFQKVLFFNYFRHDKSEPDLTDDCIFTLCLICFSKSVLPQYGTTLARLEKCHSHSAQNCCEHLYDIFQTFQNLEPGFQVFLIPDPKNVFLGLGTFWHVQ